MKEYGDVVRSHDLPLDLPLEQWMKVTNRILMSYMHPGLAPLIDVLFVGDDDGHLSDPKKCVTLSLFWRLIMFPFYFIISFRFESRSLKKWRVKHDS